VTLATPRGRCYFPLLVNDLSRYMWVVVLGSKGRLRMPSGARRLLRRWSAAVSCTCYASTMAANSQRLNSRRTARMRVFSATTSCRTARNRTARWLSTSSTARPPRLSTTGHHTRLGMGANRQSLTYGSSTASRSPMSLATSASLTTGAPRGCLSATQRARKAYRILDPGTQRVRMTRDIVFDEGRGWA
jgi:hypothetical protein